MGCDIHIVIQRQEAGEWREVPYQGPFWREDAAPKAGIPIAPDGFDGRNYNLFGLLANY